MCTQMAYVHIQEIMFFFPFVWLVIVHPTHNLTATVEVFYGLGRVTSLLGTL